jgi:hypothetical protein
MTAIHAERAAYEFQVAEMPLEQKNAALKAAVEARLFGKASDDDEHPVMADPDDESDDEPDPLHERMKHLYELVDRTRVMHPTSRNFRNLLDEVWNMHRSKSADYGEDADPLANIRQSAAAVGVEPWRGCLLRMMDKVQRLKTYCIKGTLENEGVRDTLLDLASYSLICEILREEASDA